jgi:hypothetical protein
MKHLDTLQSFNLFFVKNALRHFWVKNNKYVSGTKLIFWSLRIQERIMASIFLRDQVSERRLINIIYLTMKFLVILAVVAHEISNGLLRPKGGCW